ncbi:type II toxin-antitoxin system HicA family toxin [Actinomycetospora termitidis]|uniref:Type II toxin-antitoxin system HicA family toxin n=1 Tax=Actinomycetospora termitidis TaxID=3053470 RepID=A0ABT7MGF9_9PSEU|nr:type II toxin-antitoxin system HicA family toxin [Actinomycetospora sp. Odt1-22]MDL5159027.1 type II toxin-antitoxin system HicA family toxin [Actinomycetospora sp. Odt1-22]
MSPTLPQVSGKEVVRALTAAGFEERSTRGSHLKLRHPDGRVVIVPLHREIARGTLASVLRQAGLSTAQFLALLD